MIGLIRLIGLIKLTELIGKWVDPIDSIESVHGYLKPEGYGHQIPDAGVGPVSGIRRLASGFLASCGQNVY